MDEVRDVDIVTLLPEISLACWAGPGFCAAWTTSGPVLLSSLSVYLNTRRTSDDTSETRTEVKEVFTPQTPNSLCFYALFKSVKCVCVCVYLCGMLRWTAEKGLQDRIWRSAHPFLVTHAQQGGERTRYCPKKTHTQSWKRRTWCEESG